MKKYIKCSDSNSNFDEIKNSVLSEIDEDIDSLAEYTDAGEALMEICFEVEDELGLQYDDSYEGVGFYNDGDVVGRVTMNELNDKIYIILMRSNDVESFKSKYRKYLNSLIGE